MRGFYLFIIWIVALAATIASANIKDRKSARITVPEPDRKEVVNFDDEDDYVDDYVDNYDEEDDYIPPPPKRRSHSQLSLMVSNGFGPNTGCFVGNCTAFAPIQRMCGGYYVQGYGNSCMPPSRQRVVYEDYVVPAEAPNNFMLQQACGCAGVPTCGCSGQPQTNVLALNYQQPLPNIYSGWHPLSGGLDMLVDNRPTLFHIQPPPQPQPLGNRSFGFTPREGMDPHSGMFGI
jgi:hypothetical protein